MNVSVIIPTYRHRDYIVRTLESVFAQTYSDFEVVVVNDGSPDDTKAVLEPYVQAGRIRYFEQENKGQSCARNRGLEVARGKYIAFLDDDDLWPADKLEWQVDYLEKNPQAGMVGGTMQYIDEKDQPGKKGRHTARVDFESLFGDNPFISPGQTLIRSSVLAKVGGMDTGIWGADDWDLWFRIANSWQIVMLDRVALYYRSHPSNASKQSARLLKNCALTVKKHLPRAEASQRGLLRKRAHRWLFSVFGCPVLSIGQAQLWKGQVVEAVRSIAGILPLGRSLVLDARISKAIIREVIWQPLRQRVRTRSPESSQRE